MLPSPPSSPPPSALATGSAIFCRQNPPPPPRTKWRSAEIPTACGRAAAQWGRKQRGFAEYHCLIPHRNCPTFHKVRLACSTWRPDEHKFVWGQLSRQADASLFALWSKATALYLTTSRISVLNNQERRDNLDGVNKHLNIILLKKRRVPCSPCFAMFSSWFEFKFFVTTSPFSSARLFPTYITCCTLVRLLNFSVPLFCPTHEIHY
jgi:hypothetical protein